MLVSLHLTTDSSHHGRQESNGAAPQMAFVGTVGAVISDDEVFSSKPLMTIALSKLCYKRYHPIGV